MTREVDLVSYLPPFVAEFKEINVALDAENPEFVLVWKAADRVLKNEFIETADEYGISRFEKILNILPSREDTLESRRARVQARWISTIPYTLKILIEKMVTLCGDSDFTITKDYSNYRIEVETSLALFGQVEELERLIEGMIPCNMVVDSRNRLYSSPDTKIFIAGAIQQIAHFTVNTEIDEKKVLYGGITYAGYISTHKTMGIAADTAKEQLLIGAVQYSNVLSSHKEVTIK